MEQKRLHVISFDYGGCLLHQPKVTRPYVQVKRSVEVISTPTGFDILEGNAQLLNTIKENKDQKIVFIGSNRQSKSINSHNSLQNGGDCFVDIPKICDFIEATFDPFLLADVYGNLDAGTSYQRATDKNYSGDHVTWKIDKNKASVLYAQMHKVALENPLAKIRFVFFDDEENILQALGTFFTQFPELMPEKITLHLHHYAGAEITNKCVIKGTGSIDKDYRDTVKDMTKIADPNGYQWIDIATQVNPALLAKRKKLRLQGNQPIINEDVIIFLENSDNNESVEDNSPPTDNQEDAASTLSRFLITFGKFMRHPATKIVLFILLAAALAVLTYGLVGIGIAATAGVAVGIAAIASTAAGGGTAVASSIALGFSFFSSKKIKEENTMSDPKNPLYALEE